MRTLFLSLLIGVMTVTSVADVTSRVKVAESAPIKKSVLQSAEAHVASPVSVVLKPDIPAVKAKAITSIAPATPVVSEYERYKSLVIDIKTIPSSESISKVAPSLREVAESSRIKNLYWYDWKLYDVGTTLWAIAEKAKWYAEIGNTQKVQELYEYFVTVVQDAEAHDSEQTKE